VKILLSPATAGKETSEVNKHLAKLVQFACQGHQD